MRGRKCVAGQVSVILAACCAISTAARISSPATSEDAAADSTSGWPASFTIDQILPSQTSDLHTGLTPSIPWDQADGRHQILREQMDNVDEGLRQRLKDAIQREDFLLASQLKEQLAADIKVSQKVWADPVTAGTPQKVTATGLRDSATLVWRNIVEGVERALKPDLDGAERLVLAILGRAAQLGSAIVEIRPIRTARHYREDWQGHTEPWMHLPRTEREFPLWNQKMKEGALCWAASQEVDSVKREKLRSWCVSGNTEVIKDDPHGSSTGKQEREIFNCIRTSNFEGPSGDSHAILSASDFCKVAAGTFVETEDTSGQCHQHKTTNPRLQVRPVCPLPVVTRMVMVETGVMESTPWVFGRKAGMVYTMHRLEREWNQTLERVQSIDFDQEERGGGREGIIENTRYDGWHQTDGKGESRESSYEGAREASLSVANFLGPIGPNQPPAKPWDFSRYDVLLNVADRQLTQGMLTQEQHTHVSEHLVLAGRFHRAHAAFENALDPAWVDSLHEVFENPIARKILVWGLQNSGFNVSMTSHTATVMTVNHPREEKKFALLFDLHHPLPFPSAEKEKDTTSELNRLAEVVANGLIC